MNIFQTIFIKIAHVLTAVLVFVGIQNAPQPPNPQPTPIVIDLPAPSPTPTPEPNVDTVAASTTAVTATVPAPVLNFTPEATVTEPTLVPAGIPIYIIQPQMAPTPSAQQTQTPLIKPMSQARIEIVSPIGTKGLGRDYLARPEILDEANYVSIGAILYNDDGSVNNTADMVITATDETQNKTEKGTGDLWGNRYVNGEKQPAYFYAFDYQFKTVGDHTITFTADGQTNSITITVPAEDTRP